MRYATLCAIFLLGPGLVATSPSIPPKAPTQPFRLEDGTPVRLSLTQALSSAEAQVDDLVEFEVLEEVTVNDLVVIPKGSTAWGKVTEAHSKRRGGRGGNIQVEIRSVRLTDGERAKLRAAPAAQEKRRRGRIAVGVLATGIERLPAAPLFLLMHGKEATVPKGRQFMAYVSGDMNLDPARFESSRTPSSAPGNALQPAAPPQTPPAAPQAAASTDQLSSVAITSTPPSAEIYLDGKFMGSTPSTVRLAPGEHVLVLEKPGFKRWLRSLTVTPSGNVTIDVPLEKSP